MKSLKALTLLVLSLLITGCYTQLQYSQTAQRATEKKPTEGYSWDSDSDDGYEVNDADSIYMAETEEGKPYDYNAENSQGSDEYGEVAADDDYIPVAYKNYDVINKYEACQCNPHKTYALVDDPYFIRTTYPYYFDGYYLRHSRYYRPYRSFWGLGFYNHGFAFSIGWRSHFNYHPFYSPYYYPPYHYGYAWWYPSTYNNYYFFGNSHSGSFAKKNTNRRYGRRSIGADRVGNRTRSIDGNQSTNRRGVTGVTNTRSRTRGVTRIGSERTRSRTKVTRSRGNRGSSRVGTTRSRSSSSRSKVNVNRSRSGDNGKVRSRGKTSVTRSRSVERSRSSISRVRINRTSKPVKIDLNRQRINLKPKRSSSKRSRSIFGNFNRLFDNSFKNTRSTRFGNTRSTRKSSGSKRSVRSRSGSSSKSSSVGRSRSSGSSSKGRSRSGGGKKRSRGGGNN